MTSGITLQGISINNPLPGIWVEIDFAVGQPANVGTRRPILLMGNGTSSATATADTVIYGPDTQVTCQSEQDVINLFGTGSELHRMYRRVVKCQQAVSIYFVMVTASAGTAAVTNFTFLNVPSATCNVRIWIDDEYVDTSIPANTALGTANTGVTALVCNSINSKSWWAFTAGQATVTTSNDTVAITARIKGPRGNLHRAMAQVSIGGGGGVSNMTVTNTTDVATGGATAGATADSNATALATIAPFRFYYIASAAEDATQFGALASQVTTQALPANGRRQRCFAGSTDTLANVITLATGINNPRAEVLWLQTSPIVPSELAAIQAAVFAQWENSGAKPRCNFSGFGNQPGEVFPVIASRVAANAPTSTTSTSALLNGITPVGVNQNGSTYIVKAITSRSLLGSNNDYRIRDHHKVTVCDFFADDWQNKAALQFASKNLADDPPPGAQPATGSPAPSDTTTPNRIRDSFAGLLGDYGEPPTGSNLLVNTAQTLAATMVVREKPANNNRVSLLAPLYTIDILDQIASLLDQVA